MEKKISNVGKNVKRIEENPVSKPFGCCSVLFTPHVENEITMQTSTQACLRQNPLSERFPNEMRSAKTNTLKDIHKASQGIQKTCTIFMNGIEATIEPDTGADTNIIDENYKHKDWK